MFSATTRILVLFTAIALFAPIAALAQAPATTASADAVPKPPPIPVDPAREAAAQDIYQTAETAMKTASYDDAIAKFRTIVRRYPETQTRYMAQFGIADALVAEKNDADAITLLQSIVAEGDDTWSPRALEKIGDIYIADEKYSDAFRSYRTIITAYPDSPMVDRAHFDIGAAHFKLGHYELAADELEKVGTSYATRNPQLQKVSPGEPLYIKLTEPNSVATKTMQIPVTVTATSGDRETVILHPDEEGGDVFSAAIPTTLGEAVPGDGILELHGSDKVTLSYESRYVGGGAVTKSVVLGIASNAHLAVLDASGQDITGAVIGDTLTIEVRDADRDVSDARDTVKVTVTTKRHDSETVTLTETGAHTGVFQGEIKLVQGTPTPNSGTIETDAPVAEGSTTQLDDNIVVTYSDDVNLINADGSPHIIKDTVNMFLSSPGSVAPVAATDVDADLQIKTMLYKGRSLNQIAITYRDLGSDAKAAIDFRQAQEQFQNLITQYPNSPEVQDAMFGLFETYVGEDEYDSAIGVIAQLTQRFPQSTRASEALFELADLHVKHEEYDQALAIYQSLVQRTKGTPLAEQAQYAICTTYMAMYKPKSETMGGQPTISREEIAAALDEFARTYPNSDKTPEALFNLVQFRYDGEDYAGASDSAKRMVALYPDNVMTGRVMLLEGEALYKQHNIEGASDVYRDIIANYGSEADEAQKLLTDLERKYGAGATGGAAPAGGASGTAAASTQ